MPKHHNTCSTLRNPWKGSSNRRFHSHRSFPMHSVEEPFLEPNKLLSDDSNNISSFLESDSFERSFVDFESCEDYEEYEFLESTIDPLSYFPDVDLNLIAQHLSASELLSASEVSLNWSQKLSKSVIFMKKIVLNIDLSSLDDGLKNLLAVVKTRREYQNLNIVLKNNKGVEKIVDWMLKKFASSIVNLRLCKTGGFNSMMNRQIPYLNLKSFELHVICGRLSCALNVTTLRTLIVNGLNPEVLVSILKQNPGLKELSLYENSFISYFNEDISSNTTFKLKKLSILDHLRTGKALDGEFEASDWDGHQRGNFIKLIKLQENNLKWLTLDVCRAEDVNVIIGCLQKLKYFELNKVTGDLDSLLLDNNTSITTFIANSICEELLSAISTSLLNLKAVFIESIKTDQFFFLITNSRRLKHFRYFIASASDKKNKPFVDLKRLYNRAEMCKSLKVCIKVVKKEDFLHKIKK